MTLAFDIARCAGSPDLDSFNTLCKVCRRREPGDPQHQVFVVPAAVPYHAGSMLLRVTCENFIVRER